MLRIPDGFKIRENAEFTASLNEEGVISFAPVHKSIFAKNQEYDFKSALLQLAIKDNGDPVGKERI